MPTCFTPEEIEKLFKKISTKLYGKLKALLVVVDDDMVKKRKKSLHTDDTDAEQSESSHSILGKRGASEKASGASKAKEKK